MDSVFLFKGKGNCEINEVEVVGEGLKGSKRVDVFDQSVLYTIKVLHMLEPGVWYMPVISGLE